MRVSVFQKTRKEWSKSLRTELKAENCHVGVSVESLYANLHL